MPVNPNDKNCVRDEMRRFKAGKLHSGSGKAGKDGPVVENPKQAIAISLSACKKGDYAEVLQSIGFSQESANRVSKMLEAEAWGRQFEKGHTGGKTPKEGKATKAQGLSTMDADSRPGKQKGSQGKLKDNESGKLPPLATPSENPQPGPRSLQLKGLRSFDEPPQGLTTGKICPPRKPREDSKVPTGQPNIDTQGEMPKNPKPEQSETQMAQNKRNKCTPSGEQGAGTGLT
jgi:organic hydroperoxide reductase OsmC/OhrA